MKNNKRQTIIKVLKSMLLIDRTILQYQFQNENDTKKKELIKKNIALNEAARKYITTIRHDDILEDVYGYIVSGKEMYFNIVAATLMSEKIHEWDTEEGFKEFKKLQAQKIKEMEEKKNIPPKE